MKTEPIERLAAMVVKQGLALGLLSESERTLALALAWRGLPAARVMNEREVNEALKAQLEDDGPASFLATDHVELRRWLVDAGWLRRDGFGREYRRVEPPGLASDDARAAASALSIVDPRPWCAGRRAAKADEREARRRAWQAREGWAQAATATR